MNTSARRRDKVRRWGSAFAVLAITASAMFVPKIADAANPSANLDQCANDPAPSPNTDGCSASASNWVNGNVNEAKAVYLEGDSLPYRMTFDNLATTGTHTVTIEWDTTKASTHALDYLTTFDRTVATANPCLGIVNCGSPTTFPIPADPQVTGGGVTPIAGNFTMFGATITAVSPYSYADGVGFSGDKSARITITFTASQANPVLAWGGHIASRSDWGALNSASAISGSPYHTRLIDLDGSGGNQDRSLSAGAVIFPGSITIVKQATPEGPTSFPFTASPAPLTNFSLVDDGTIANTKTFSNITNFQTYSVAETVSSPWNLTGISCAVASPNGGSQTVTLPSVSINLKEGENVTCTYSNARQAAHLIVIKHVVNDSGGTSVASGFTMTINGLTVDGGSSFAGAESPGTDKTLSTVGGYNVTESGPSGYGATFSTDCTGTIALGQTKTCTITNNDAAPQLHLRKVVVNDNGGTATVANFILTADGTGTNDLSGTSPVDSGAGLLPDTWTLSESGLAGYSNDGWVCVGGTRPDASHVTVGIGGNATCTITNNDTSAHLQLIKTVTNDNGGAALPAAWTLTADGTATNDHSGAGGFSLNVNPDTYVLSESGGPAGYIAGSWSCVTNGGAPVTGASINLALGDSAVCTINNNDIAPQLHLRKIVTNDNGGTATVTDFILTADGTGTNDLSGTSPVDSSASLVADTWALSESGVAGYSNAGWVCVGGTQLNANITVGIGQSATCTITNNDTSAHLQLIKTVTNDNGGAALPAAWTLTADGTGANDHLGAGGFSLNVNADTYALSESGGPAGYIASSWSCVTNGGTAVTGASIKLALGDSAICTINNNDVAPQLHLVKVVTNDNGGTATVANFTLTADGTGTNDLSGTSPVDSGASLKADTWALSESGVAGYSTTGWVCVGGTQLGANITVGIGQSATCTITNNDIQPTLTLVKTVINDNGGTKTVADFPLFVSGNGVVSGVSNGFDAGTYSASETSLFGYAASAWGGDCDTTGSVTLHVGEHKTCTITNNDIAPQLHLRKVVVNDNGGTATVANFTLTANGAGSNDLSRTSPVDSGAGLLVDTWTLTESGPAGYSTTGWDCVGGTQADASHVSVGIGQSATCTITNNDIAPKLTLNKIVINDNGGTALESAWTLSATGDPVTDPAVLSGPGTAGSTDVVSGALFDAGTYVLSESVGPAGYAASNWSCTGGQIGTEAKVTLGLGDNITCTITNNDTTAHLQLIKTVTNDNGGAALPTAWTLAADGTDTNDLSGAGGFSLNVNADTYVLSESGGPAGYIAGSWSCVTNGGTAVTGASVKLVLGDSAICTINNNDIAPQLHLRKVVVNDNGGTATVANFTLTADGTAANDVSGTSPVDSGASLVADTWALSESGVAGYSNAGWVCVGGTQTDANITVGIGQSATCTITNNDIAPQLHLRKIIVNDNGGTATVANFTLTADGTGTNDVSGTSPVDSSASLVADTWALSESGVAGYSNAGWVCVGGTQTDANITVGIGQSATCTITNDDIAPTITLHKVVVNNDGGTLKAADFSLQIGGTTVAQDTVLQQVAGVALDIDELRVQGYLPTGVSCTSNLGLEASTGGTAAITVAPRLAENVTCTITNDDVRPGLTVVKNVVNDNGGNAVVSDFVLHVNGGQVISAEPNLYPAATPLVVSEVQVTGYVATGTICVSDLVESNNSVTLPGGTATITLSLGEAVLCTITNDDQAPTITVNKNVVNDDGRGAVVSDFPLFVGTTAVTSGVAQTVDANQSYTVGETQQDGYALTSLACVNAAGAPVTNPVVPNEGDRITCTLVNDDTPITDLQIVKTTSTPSPLVGTFVTYTLTVSNNGPSSAHDVSVVDPMPAPLVLESVSSADFTCSSANNAITCTRPLLLVGHVGTITVTALVPLTAIPGSNLQNVATVSTVMAETTLANNQSSVSVSPFAVGVLSVVPPVAPPVVELPRTGIDVGLLVRFAALLATAGVFAVGVSRRRKRDRGNVAY